MNRTAEEMRIRYLYRTLILKKKIILPLDAAKKLIGPDCAYHLYALVQQEDERDNKGSA
jgi:hypothetical protein